LQTIMAQLWHFLWLYTTSAAPSDDLPDNERITIIKSYCAEYLFLGL